MDDTKKTDKSDDLKNEFENLRLYYARTLESIKILPWELDVEKMEMNNIFGMNILFSERTEKVSFSKWLEMIYHEDKELVLTSVKSMFEGVEDEYVVEYRITKDTGDLIWLKTIAKIRLRDENGKPSIITGINQDITESKLLELQNLKRDKKIRDNESRLKNAMKIGRMSPWEYSYDKEVIISDREMADMFGFADYYDRGDPIKFSELNLNIYPEDRDFVLEHFKKSVDSYESFELSFRIVVNEVIKHVHLSSEVICDDDGKPLKLVGIAQDISTMKVLEDSITKQYEGLKLIAEKARLGLWELDVRDKYIFTISKNYNRPESDSIFNKISSSDFIERIHPEDFEMFKSKLDLYTEIGGKISDFDIRLNTDGDIFRWFHITAFMDKTDESGRPLLYKGLYQDITERKEIEGQLYQSQKMEAVGRLAGGIAHDFNNILQVILGYGSLALMDAGENSDMLENITHIVDSGEKAKSLVRQLLLFARREKFRPSPIDLNSLASGFTTMLKRVIGENINLVFNPDPELHCIHGDAGQLEQVFMNLCINSRDAIDGFGSIVIKTKNITTDSYWSCYDNRIPPGSYVILSVSDTGSGIPAEGIGQIFEPFYTTKGKNRGTGIGLATVYSIVKQHGSYIDVRSIEGKGTTFSLYFPVYGEIESVNNKNYMESVSNFHRGSETVLLAEDDDLIRKYTSRILLDSGFKVIIAEDGESAVKLYNENRDVIDLLIFDVVMPKKNGWDVYLEIGGVEKRVPVIFFSGYDQNLLPEEVTKHIPMVYVQKPFKYYTIIKAIHDLLDRKI